MIINYLVGIAFIALSVGSFSKIFIKEDKEINKVRESFIKKTRNSHRGSISLVGACFCLILTFFMLFLLQKMRIEFNEAKYRKESYICFHYLNQLTKKYVNEMGHFNKSLAATFAAQMAPGAGAISKAAHNTLIITRNIRHLFYVKDYIKNSYCKDQLEYVTYFKNWPFKQSTLLKLQTNFDGSAIINKNKWTTSFTKKPKGIRLKNAFILKAEHSATNSYFPNYKITTQEKSRDSLFTSSNKNQQDL